MEAPGEVGRSGAPGEVGGPCPVVGQNRRGAPGEVGGAPGEEHTNEADENRRTAFELQQQRVHRERDGTANAGSVRLDGVKAEAG